MAIDKITTTPTPMGLVDKVNTAIDGINTNATNISNKLDKTGTAAAATKATQDGSGNVITSTYATKAQAVTSLSASGTTVTYTKADGSTGTFTTQDTDTTYSAATTSAAGLMSAADKTKLDGVATGANAYSLPTASSSTLGGIKVGSGLSISDGVLSASGGSAAVSAYKIPYATCSTATSTAAKVATITNGVSFSLEVGASVVVRFSNINTAGTPTLNINSTGAKNMISGRNSTSWGRVDFAEGDYEGVYEYDATGTLLCTYTGSQYACVGCALGYISTYSYSD